MAEHILHNHDHGAIGSTSKAAKVSILLVHQDASLIQWFENDYARDGALRVVPTPESAINIVKNGFRAQLIVGDVMYTGKSSLDFFVQMKYLHPEGIRVIFSRHVDQDHIRRFADLTAVQKFVTLPRSGPDIRHQLRLITEQYFHGKRKQVALMPLSMPDKGPKVAEERTVIERREDHMPTHKAEQRLAEQMNFHCIRTMTSFIPEFTNYYYSNHAHVVAEISSAIAQTLGLSDELIHNISMAALLHDIGKCGMEERILRSSSENLTPEDAYIYQTHIERGTQLIGAIPGMERIVEIVAQHHEHFDGSGFPNKLEGKQILQGAMILGIADLYHNRVYRIPNFSNAGHAALIPDLEFTQAETEYRQAQALAYMRLNAQWFDPVVLEAFVKVAEKGQCRPVQMGKVDTGTDEDLVNAITRKYIAMNSSDARRASKN